MFSVLLTLYISDLFEPIDLSVPCDPSELAEHNDLSVPLDPSDLLFVPCNPFQPTDFFNLSDISDKY
jgi:hypothetical protein